MRERRGRILFVDAGTGATRATSRCGKNRRGRFLGGNGFAAPACSSITRRSGSIPTAAQSVVFGRWVRSPIPACPAIAAPASPRKSPLTGLFFDSHLRRPIPRSTAAAPGFDMRW